MEDTREGQRYATQLKKWLANVKLDLEMGARTKTRLQEQVKILQQQLQRLSAEVWWDMSQRICLGKKKNNTDDSN